MLVDPYADLPVEKHPEQTEKLAANFFSESGLKKEALIELVLKQFDDIMNMQVGARKACVDFFPTGQTISNLMDDTMKLEISKFKGWRGGIAREEKDLIHEDSYFSTEVKVSSHAHEIPGNKKREQKTKVKFQSGFYVIVNYKRPTKNEPDGYVRTIRFGWLNDADWRATANSGNKASVPPAVARNKLVTLYSKDAKTI